MKTLFFIFMMLLRMNSVHAGLNAFASDGCSKWLDGTILDPDKWKICCFNHDIAYWMGGTKAEKEQADKELKSCVTKKDSVEMGVIMWAGVAIGGSPNFSTGFRWGYGWDEKRGYRALTPREKKMVAEELASACLIGEQDKLIKKALRTKGLIKLVPPYMRPL